MQWVRIATPRRWLEETLADDVWSIGHLGAVPGAHHDPGEALLFPVFPFEVWTLETEDAEKTRIVSKVAALNPARETHPPRQTAR